MGLRIGLLAILALSLVGCGEPPPPSGDAPGTEALRKQEMSPEAKAVMEKRKAALPGTTNRPDVTK